MTMYFEFAGTTYSVEAEMAALVEEAQELNLRIVAGELNPVDALEAMEKLVAASKYEWHQVTNAFLLVEGQCHDDSQPRTFSQAIH